MSMPKGLIGGARSRALKWPRGKRLFALKPSQGRNHRDAGRPRTVAQRCGRRWWARWGFADPYAPATGSAYPEDPQGHRRWSVLGPRYLPENQL
jgi:hypothetical protein